MVITVSKEEIRECKAEVAEVGFSPTVLLPPGEPNTPQYHSPNGTPHPYAQLDLATEIPACDSDTNRCTYRQDGY